MQITPDMIASKILKSSNAQNEDKKSNKCMTKRKSAKKKSQYVKSFEETELITTTKSLKFKKSAEINEIYLIFI